MPIRTCVACRTRAEKSELLRWVVDADGEARTDPRARATGRGRYVCRTDDCLARLLRWGKRRGIGFGKSEPAFRLAIRGEVPENAAGETHEH
ncbi:YlxR family protein [bacterium]|nr:YlxR family protein [bacterium]